MFEKINQIRDYCHQNNIDAGWYTDINTGARIDRNVPEMLALIISEITEGLEAYRKNLMDDKLPYRKGIEVEMADALIRIFDLCGYLNLDIQGALEDKVEFNKNRADHKIENRKKADGKKF